MIVVGSIPVTHLPAPEDKVTDNKNGSIQVNGSSITPADDSKVVHSKDMRKSASDVAGIEEVNAKQDKIGYTPADDSKVVHTTGDETIDGKKKFNTDPTDGAGNAYAKTVDVNQQLDNKVTDNKDGTEQLNGVRVQPYNKLSDTIGGRNLLTGTSSGLKTKQLTNNYNVRPQATNGDFKIKVIKGQTYTYRAWIDNTNGPDNAFVAIRLFPIGAPKDFALGSGSIIGKGETGYSTFVFTLPEDGYIQLTPFAYSGPETALVSWKEEKLEKGSVATDWTPAPEDKVNVSDMRKPASDVAGIEEVGAKQDKIGYTPADNSKVVHNSGNEEISGQKKFDTAPIDKTTGNPYITKDGVPSDVARTGQANTFNLAQTFSQGVKTLQTGSYSDANSLVNEGLYYNTNSSIKNVTYCTPGYIQVMSGYGKIVRQIMYSDTDGGMICERISQDGGSSWSSWTEIVTWDQLPSNMALTNQSQTFTSQQTFSIAPIDKTTGNPYITKDDVPKVDLNGYVIDNKDNTVTANSVKYDLSKTDLTSLSLYDFGSFNNLPLGTVLADASSMADGPNSSNAFITTTFYSSQFGGHKAQIAINTFQNSMYFRGGLPAWNNWMLVPSDSDLVHNTGSELIGGQKTFGVAPIDQTTGHPYITKSDVPTYIEASKNDEASAISDSQASNSGNIYYWTVG